MDESRKQFELMAAKELCMQPEMVEKDRKGNGYNHKPLNLWWKIWQASRAAIEIDLPMPKYTCFSQGFYKGIAEQRKNDTDAIRAAGIKVKE
ncbi:TPA: hypothetical protein ACI4GT_002935 [Enterobacter hormaechei]|nr:hypothetical protein [Enterobacter hormaechei]EHN8879796.1 hypothetical protein [Enterobacter hormaechei]